MNPLVRKRPAIARQTLPPWRRSGFTLIELLVLVALLASLALFAIPRLAQHRQTEAITLGTNNLNSIRLAMHNYRTAEGVLPTNWQPLHDGGYVEGYLVEMDGLSASKDGYRFTFRSSGCDSGSGCSDSPIIVDAKPLSAAISSVDLSIKEDGEVVSKVDEKKVEEQEKLLKELAVDVALAVVKTVAESGETDVAGALNSVSEDDVKVAVAILTGEDKKFDKDDLARLAGTESEPENAVQECFRKVLAKLEIGTAGEADNVKVEFPEDFQLPADWHVSLFDWDYYIALVEQIELKGPRTALLSVGQAAAEGEERTQSNTAQLYDAIERQVNALERSGALSTSLAAKIREFLSVRRL